MNSVLYTILNLIEIIGIILIFWGVLGFQFKKEIMNVICYIVIVALAIVGELSFHGFIYGALYITPLAICFSHMLIFSELKPGITFLAYTALISIRKLFTGLVMLMFNVVFGDNVSQGILISDIVGHLLFLIGVCIACVVFYHKRNKIHEELLKKDQLMYFFLGLVFMVLFMDIYSKSVNPSVLLVNGWETFVKGTVGVFILCLIILSFILERQKQKLEKLNQLNKKCMEEQTRQYVFLNSKQQEINKFRHDNTAHMRTLRYLVEEGNTEKVRDYMSQLVQKEQTTKYIDTGNIIGDAIINQYWSLSQKNDIEFKIMGRFADTTVSETDLCIILTNIISNAYEATTQCSDLRQIEIELTNYKNRQFIKVSNTTKNKIEIEKGLLNVKQSSKDDYQNHGLGISNVIDAVERNYGTIEWSSRVEKENNYVQVTVMVTNVENQ